MGSSATDVAHFHPPFAVGGWTGGFLAAAQLGIAVVTSLPEVHQRGTDVFIGQLTAQQAPQVMALVAEQAGEELAFGGQPQTRAVAAERLGDGGDDADLASAVEEAPALGITSICFTILVGMERNCSAVILRSPR